jgi:hypothetical protein
MEKMVDAMVKSSTAAWAPMVQALRERSGELHEKPNMATQAGYDTTGKLSASDVASVSTVTQ